MIAEPPSLAGADHETEALPEPGVTAMFCGAVGGAITGPTDALAALVVFVPSVPVAVTTPVKYLPRSALVGEYVDDVAPDTTEQFGSVAGELEVAEHECHWYVKFDVAVVHSPLERVRASPTCGG